MNVNSDIQHTKNILKVPYHKDQLEYWGPVNHIFADSFLTMGHTFIYQYFSNLNSTFLKSVFSSLVEMVQNVSKYNEENCQDNLPQSLIRLKDGGGHVVVNTVNRIKLEDKLYIQSIFEKIFSIPENELFDEYKRLLLKGESVGLIMLRKLNNTNIEYSFSENQEAEAWLSIELKMNYGNT